VGPVLYIAGNPIGDLGAYAGQLLEVHIMPRDLTTKNTAYKERQIWGSGIYTEDSDVVCSTF
jgi:hypothetical protein